MPSEGSLPSLSKKIVKAGMVKSGWSTTKATPGKVCFACDALNKVVFVERLEATDADEAYWQKQQPQVRSP
jgi:hypothetical protein